MGFIRKFQAFIKKDFLEMVSYKFAFLLQVISIFFSITIFFFLGKSLGKAILPHLEKYGGDFFSFILIGIAFSSYIYLGLNSFADSIREAQLKGTLEALLLTPTSIYTIIFCSSIWGFILATLRVALYLLLGNIVFGVEMGGANYLGAIVILVLTILAFCSIGILSASFIIIFKRGNPINWVFGSASALLGGIYFPISVMPDWLQHISYLLPITHSLEAMRHLLLQGYPLDSVMNEVRALFIFCVLLLPLSLAVFNLAVKIAKREGTLVHY